MKRDREAHHWTAREFAVRTKTHYATISRVENGHQPMNERLAMACDEQFPERRGWYLAYYEESKEWTPAGFRDWREYEEKATEIRSWSPSVVDGMLQTPGYARALLSTIHAAPRDQIEARLASRMQRQQRVLYRPEPPQALFIVDELSLYRCVGSPEIMAAQCRHLIEVAGLPHVTLQVLRAVANAVSASNLILTDTAAYAEHLLSSGVYTDAESVTASRRLMASIAAESHTASVTLEKIEHMERTWKALGESQATARKVARTA